MFFIYKLKETYEIWKDRNWPMDVDGLSFGFEKCKKFLSDPHTYDLMHNSVEIEQERVSLIEELTKFVKKADKEGDRMKESGHPASLFIQKYDPNNPRAVKRIGSEEEEEESCCCVLM